MKNFNEVKEFKVKHYTPREAYDDLKKELCCGFNERCINQLTIVFAKRWNWSDGVVRHFIGEITDNGTYQDRNFILYQEMAKRSLKQSDLARLAGVSQSTISRMLNNKKVAQDAINKVAAVFNKTPTELGL